MHDENERHLLAFYERGNIAVGTAETIDGANPDLTSPRLRETVYREGTPPTEIRIRLGRHRMS